MLAAGLTRQSGQIINRPHKATKPGSLAALLRYPAKPENMILHGQMISVSTVGIN